MSSIHPLGRLHVACVQSEVYGETATSAQLCGDVAPLAWSAIVGGLQALSAVVEVLLFSHTSTTSSTTAFGVGGRCYGSPPKARCLWCASLATGITPTAGDGGDHIAHLRTLRIALIATGTHILGLCTAAWLSQSRYGLTSEASWNNYEYFASIAYI